MIVGGGIVGMATARQLAISHPNLKYAVVEKENEMGKLYSACLKNYQVSERVLPNSMSIILVS